MFTLMRDGQLAHVSALMDGTDALGFGLMTVTSKDEAEAILREDPAVRGGRLVVELLSSMSFDGELTRTHLQ